MLRSPSSTERALIGWVLVAVVGCAAGTPPGFTSVAGGDRWTFPLVGPLEDGLLLTPVTIGSSGPFLFAIDPDAPISAVDGEVARTAQLRTFNGPHRLDENDTPQARFYAEVVGFEIGTLIIERQNVMVVRPHTFDAAGRRIHGVLGRDVLADTLVAGFDRDQGLGFLQAVSSWKPPAGATALGYGELPSQIQNATGLPPPRRILKTTINGAGFDLHVDLGATASQLRSALWERAGLVPRDVPLMLVDEVGTPHKIERASDPVRVTAGPLASERVAFVPYLDKRWEEQFIGGTLGLGFFAPFSVWLDPHHKQLHLTPRRALPLAARVGRWETGPLQKCPHAGCVTIRVVDPLAGKPLEEGKAHPGVILSLTRDEIAGGMGLEVLLEATGKPELPRLIVNLPPHVDRAMDQLPAAWIGATIDVLDASPFPRACPGNGACIDKLAR